MTQRYSSEHFNVFAGLVYKLKKVHSGPLRPALTFMNEEEDSIAAQIETMSTYAFRLTEFDQITNKTGKDPMKQFLNR